MAPSPSPATPHISNTKALRAQFNLKDGDWFNATLIGKGLDNLQEAYGQTGYINFGAIPKPVFDEPETHCVVRQLISMKASSSMSRGSSSRATPSPATASSAANCMLDEGQVYNSQLWEYSLLRLNQLEYFDPLKVDQDSESASGHRSGHRRPASQGEGKGQKLHRPEWRRQRTVRRLPRAELPDQQLPWPGRNTQRAGNLGNVSRQFIFGFTEPYFRNRPLNLGFQIFNNKYDFNAAKNYQTSTGLAANLSAAQQSLVQNYNQASTGFNLSASYPLRRHAFQRIGFDIFMDRANITAFSTASQTFFQTISFRGGIQGANALNGIITSQLSFSYSLNTINNPVRPRSGKEYTAAFQLAGLWGNVRYFSPFVAYKSYRSMHGLMPSANGRNILAMRAQLGYIQGFGGAVAPPQSASMPAAKTNYAASMFAAQPPMAMSQPAQTFS